MDGPRYLSIELDQFTDEIFLTLSESHKIPKKQKNSAHHNRQSGGEQGVIYESFVNLLGRSTRYSDRGVRTCLIFPVGVGAFNWTSRWNLERRVPESRDKERSRC